jgi:hypothetical protein
VMETRGLDRLSRACPAAAQKDAAESGSTGVKAPAEPAPAAVALAAHRPPPAWLQFARR